MSDIILIMLLIAATVYDCTTDKIPNQLVLIGMILGMINSVVTLQIKGILLSIGSVVAVVLGLFLLFVIKGLGAGDIKLLAMTSAFLHKEVITIIILSFLFGGVLSIIKLIKKTVSNSQICLAFGLAKQAFLIRGIPSQVIQTIQTREKEATGIHFAGAILLAAICFYIQKGINH